MISAQKISEQNSKNVSAGKSKPFFPAVIQKKLSIGSSHDSFETEADSVAEKIVNTSSFSVQRSSLLQPADMIVNNVNAVQRKCSHCEEEEKLRKKSSGGAAQPNTNLAPAHIENQIYSSQGSGQTMDKGTKNFMETRFGVDFSAVRIHTDSRADAMSKNLNARAFTVGNNIYFKNGEYSPSQNSGKFLLAHELTHTLQQSGGKIKKLGVKSTHQPKIQRGILDRIGEIASSVWDRTGGALLSIGGRVADWAEERAESIINTLAPGLLSFLRTDIVSPVREMIERGLDRITGGLFSRLQHEGLYGVLNEFVDGIFQTLQGSSGAACNSFALGAEKIVNFIRQLKGNAVSRLRTAFNNINRNLGSIWSHFAVPALDGIRLFAGEAFTYLSEKVNLAWGLISPLRTGLSAAWNWISRTFNISWQSTESIWFWIVARITPVWNRILAALNPVRIATSVIENTIRIFSSLNPLEILANSAASFYGALQFVTSSWGTNILVRSRNMLNSVILQPVLRGMQVFKNVSASAISWMQGMLGTLQSAFQILVGRVIQSGIFSVFTNAVQSVSTAVFQTVARAVSRLSGPNVIMENIIQNLNKKAANFNEAVDRVNTLAQNPWMFPLILLSPYWAILPDCFKPALINFTIRTMIGVVLQIRQTEYSPNDWALMKQRIITFLQHTLAASDEEKIIAVNRFAVLFRQRNFKAIMHLTNQAYEPSA
ncbi:hypothetical protein ASG31_03965 [Chryseobacterium sp. Leaf404]|uniref:eCIS core domain-containing protein n=1 Tax=unclassified Chryseobacterium TaxID=2593645 RepID=UPI0006F9B749|nr:MULTISPECIES: DUF4157 domain-containing protein [unclassified Chryseobacterium]KQT17903.1 hypothetical protein ASG31_03965 [Chryseobacterium sp. Leaf404]